jgi:hypothetical protein
MQFSKTTWTMLCFIVFCSFGNLYAQNLNLALLSPSVLPLKAVKHLKHAKYASADEREWYEPLVYGDIIVTPVMAYTIRDDGSNIPTYFLLNNGIKGNLGFELGLMWALQPAVPDHEKQIFLTLGASFHIVGVAYGGNAVINLANEQRTNHRHTRYFMGVKYIPFNKAKYLTVGASAGLGNIFANLQNQNINGEMHATTSDVSISVSIGLNQLVFQ